MKRTLLIISSIILFSCQPSNELSPDQIVAKAIEQAGGQRYQHSEIIFKFRNKRYKSIRENGEFSLQRSYVDSLGSKIIDELTNTEFRRKINDSLVTLSQKTESEYSNSVNSVHYFVQLPFGLNSEAVHKKLVGTDSVKGQAYYEIKVTFAAEGGGTDHDDQYLYWINKTDFTVDYLAYNYQVNGGGVRFREAYNPRIINGIRFVDYRNYKYKDKQVALDRLDNLFMDGQLEKVSDIKTTNIEVTRLP